MLKLRGQTMHLTMTDNGKGFDSLVGGKSAGTRNGFGLSGMQERVRLIGGTITLTSSVGTGTTVQISIPLQDQHGEADHT